jgi:hypothetical protein
MRAIDITNSTQFATELVRAALPVVGRRFRNLHGVWKSQKITMRNETPGDRVGELAIYFHSGDLVRAECKIFKDNEDLWRAGKARITLPNGSVWEVFGSLNENYCVEFDSNQTTQLKR